jgi:4,5-dihydroxyphthalate decarboxylase
VFKPARWTDDKGGWRRAKERDDPVESGPLHPPRLGGSAVMSEPSFSFACGLYDRVLPLYTGEVEPEGFDLRFLAVDSPRQIFDQMTGELKFDMCELSCSEFVSWTSAGRCPLVAIPAFPSRVFRHGCIVVNDRAGIRTPKDLEGKRVGTPVYTSTAAVYTRGLLRHEYGVDLDALHWVQGDFLKPGKHGNPHELPLLKPVAIEPNGSDKSLSSLLEENAIQATLGSSVPPCLGQHPDVRLLFPNFREVEIDYYRRTGVFPIMHLVAIKKSVHDAHPFVAAAMYRALCQAKDVTWKRMRHRGSLRYMLPWMWAEMEEIERVFGGDPWPYGIEPNRRTLETFIGYLVEQSMIASAMPIDDLFVPV